jgi:hypothetical protein
VRRRQIEARERVIEDRDPREVAGGSFIRIGAESARNKPERVGRSVKCKRRRNRRHGNHLSPEKAGDRPNLRCQISDVTSKIEQSSDFPLKFGQCKLSLFGGMAIPCELCAPLLDFEQLHPLANFLVVFGPK